MEQLMISELETKDPAQEGPKWPMVKLGEISASIDYGVTASANFDGNGNKFLRITDIQENGVDWKTVPWCVCSDKELNSSRLNSGDIVFARTGATTGKSFLIQDCPLNTVFASYLIRVRLENCAFPNFVSFFFQSPNYWRQVKNSARGAAQPGINSTVLKSLEIPLPPLPDQQRIVTRLDLAQQLINQRKEQLVLMGSLVQSLFYEMFEGYFSGSQICTWEKIEDCLTIIDYRGKTPEKSNSGIRLITAKNVRPYTVNDEPREYIPSENYLNWMTRGLPQSGDVVFTTEAPLGYAAVLSVKEPVVIGQRLLTLRPNPQKHTPEFLMYCLHTEVIQFEIFSRSTGSTVKGIRSKEFKLIKIPLPPLPLQQAFSDRVQQIEALKQQMQASLTELEYNFKAMMQEAFGA